MPRKKEGRAAQGAGTIRKRSDGRWEARYTAGRDPGTGKQIQKSIYGKTQGEVRKKLAAITVGLDEGTYQDPKKMTVAAWLEIWQADYLGGVQVQTVTAYRSITKNHLIPAFGAVLLQKLQPHQVQRFYNNLAVDHAPKTVRNIYGVLHRALEKAVDLKYIKTNPADADLCILPKKQKYEIHPLDHDQIPVFLEAAADDPYRDLYALDLFTGLRSSELVGLTWDCIDFQKGTIYIHRQLLCLKGGYAWGLPKHGKKRTLSPASLVMDHLHTIRTKQLEARLAAGTVWMNDEDFVFTNARGGHFIQETVRKHFKAIAKTMDLPDLRLHDLRHSYAVASLEAGDDIKTLSENLGHHSVAFTLDVYGHYTDSMRKKSSERMNDYISNTLDGKL